MKYFALLGFALATVFAATASSPTEPLAPNLCFYAPLEAPVIRVACASTVPSMPPSAPPDSPTPMPSVPPTANPTPTPKPTAVPTAPPTVPPGAALWQIGGPGVVANTNQCPPSGPTFPTPTSADFVLVKDGTKCSRNQWNPVGNGGSGVYLLNSGQQYTWLFQTTSKMGFDTGKFTQRLVWQIHDYGCGGSPLTVLGIQNFVGPSGPQVWYMSAGGKTWETPYTEGATDTWKIVVTNSTTTTGSAAFYRNGNLIGSASNIRTFVCGAKPWFNFGPYMWNWIGNGSGTSSLTRVQITFDYLKMQSP